MATLFGGKEHVPFFRHSWDELHAFVAETEIKGSAFVDLRISGTLGVTLLMANISVVVGPFDSGQVRSVCTGNVHTIQLMDMHDCVCALKAENYSMLGPQCSRLGGHSHKENLTCLVGQQAGCGYLHTGGY